ncbi:MAG: cysteine hydrolase family protein [Desulfohalobiaceae bacterium]
MQEGPSSPALAIVDMQNDFVQPGGTAHVQMAQGTVPRIREAASYFRQQGWPVIYIFRVHRADGSDAEITRRQLFRKKSGVCVRDSWGAKIVQDLEVVPGDFILTKQRFSAFMSTELDLLLRRLQVDTLVLAGTQLPNCIRATAVDALSRDYMPVVLTDACSAQDTETAESNIKDMLNMGMHCLPFSGLPSLLEQP